MDDRELDEARFAFSRREPLPENQKINRMAPRLRKKQGLYDGICDFAGDGTQPLAPDSRRIREESNPAIIRDLVKAHPIQPCNGPHAVRARALAGVSAYRRQVWRPDSGSHRSACA